MQKCLHDNAKGTFQTPLGNEKSAAERPTLQDFPTDQRTALPGRPASERRKPPKDLPLFPTVH